MKLLFITSYFFPETVASSYIGDNMRERLTDSGIEIDLVVPMPSRGIPESVRRDYRTKKFELQNDGKLRIYRFPLLREPRNPLLRFFRYSISCLKQFRICASLTKRWHHEVLFSASTPPIQGLLGAILSKLKKVPFVYNLQDIFPDSLVGTGLAKKNGLLWKIGRKIEDFTYRNADKIIVISRDFKKNIMAKGVPEDKIVVIYNWVDENAVVDVPRSENILFDKYKLDRKKFYVTYSGNIGLTQNLDLLLEVAAELKEEYPDIHFVMVGDGAYKPTMEHLVEERNLSNVSFLPFQPYEDISYVFSLGDAGLVISKPGVGANSVPSKTWSIMSASRPVLANFDENELKSIISDNNCGIFSKAGDKEAFKASIVALYNDRALGKSMGENGRRFILENLTREKGTQKYVDVIKSFEKQ